MIIFVKLVFEDVKNALKLVFGASKNAVKLVFWIKEKEKCGLPLRETALVLFAQRFLNCRSSLSVARLKKLLSTLL